MNFIRKGCYKFLYYTICKHFLTIQCLEVHVLILQDMIKLVHLYRTIGSSHVDNSHKKTLTL